MQGTSITAAHHSMQHYFSHEVCFTSNLSAKSEDGISEQTLTISLACIWGKQAGMFTGVSTVSCHPALDVHSPALSPLPTSTLRADYT